MADNTNRARRNFICLRRIEIYIAIPEAKTSPKNKGRSFGPRVPGAVKNGFTSAGERAVVVTLTVAVTGWTPSGATELGETAQVAARGAPEQFSDMGWLNPPLGWIVNV